MTQNPMGLLCRLFKLTLVSESIKTSSIKTSAAAHQALPGHTTMNATQIYTNVGQERMAALVNKR